MPIVTLELTRWLSERLGFCPTASRMTVDALDGESVTELARRLASQGSGGWSALYDPDRHALRDGVLVIINGRIADACDRSPLQPGDAVLFLPSFEGG